MITENVSVKVFSATFLFFLIYVLIKPIVTTMELRKMDIITLPLLFFMWIGSSVVLANLADNISINLNAVFLFITFVFVSLLILLFFTQRNNYKLVLLLTGVYLFLSFISIYF